jgi:hypothetical protein
MNRPVLYVTGSRAPRPVARRAIFCDGGRDASYRDGIDLELSHWIPNATPPQFKADTSTATCLRFLAAPEATDYDLVINNHADVDGVLSTFVLLHSQLALRHRETLVQAAEIGDFSSWGTPAAQHLAQALLCLMVDREALDGHELYRRCYQRIHAVLTGERFAECADGLQALAASMAYIENGSIERTQLGERFVHYAIPRSLAETDLAAALHIPPFNVPFSRAALLWPHARAKRDRERVQLVSTATRQGLYYDLWYPGYVWADIVTLWRAPGIQSAAGSNEHTLAYSQLADAVAELSRLETAAGIWSLASRLSPFDGVPGRNFPVVLSFMHGGRPAPSALPGDVVTGLLAPVLATLG